MALQVTKDSIQPTEGSIQRIPSECTETATEQTNRDSLPKYYPKDHEVTRWLINQMRCRNGLHHLVNLANVQPSLLSAYFELFDQPHIYIEARTGPGMPAYGIKTVLYLTPLAIAVYFRLRSVLRLLLDTSGTRIHARARQEIDVNAVCYVRRTKPRPGPFVMDEYSTTYPAIIAVRREFFAGLTMLMTAGFRPQAPIGIVERMGTPKETTFWFVDLLDYCVKLLNTRPGVDVIGLLQTISYRGLADVSSMQVGYYDPCVYDVRVNNNSDPELQHMGPWCSVFFRLARKGASRNYSNCGNRLIGLLEHVVAAGFFRQKYMPKGPVQYDASLLSRRLNRIVNTKKMTPEMINNLNGPEKDAAKLGIAVDRDASMCLLTLWLERVRNRCLERQAQRLFRLLTMTLSETELLNDFLFPSVGTDFDTAVHPYWLANGLAKMLPRPSSHSLTVTTSDFMDEDPNEICELEGPQVNEIRQEIGALAHSLGIVDYSKHLYDMSYQRTGDTSSFRGAVGDANKYLHETVSPAVGLRAVKLSPSERELQNRCASEDFDCSFTEKRNSLKVGDIATEAVPRKCTVANNRPVWTSANRTMSMSPKRLTSKLSEVNVLKLHDYDENKNNQGDGKTHTKEENHKGFGEKVDVAEQVINTHCSTTGTTNGISPHPGDRLSQPKTIPKRLETRRIKRTEKQKPK